MLEALDNNRQVVYVVAGRLLENGFSFSQANADTTAIYRWNRALLLDELSERFAHSDGH